MAEPGVSMTASALHEYSVLGVADADMGGIRMLVAA
jgi:hypothetical protein